MPLIDSWYMRANIPGKSREQLSYLGGVEESELECRKALENLDGFTVVHEVETRVMETGGRFNNMPFAGSPHWPRPS